MMSKMFDEPKTSKLAIASLALSLFIALPLISAIASIALALMALNVISNTANDLKGKHLAISAVVISLTQILFVFILLGFIWMKFYMTSTPASYELNGKEAWDKQIEEDYSYINSPEHFEQAIGKLPEPDLQKVNKKAFWLYYGLGFTLMDSGEKNKAIKAFEQALNVSKKEIALSYYHIGSIRMNNDDYRQALKDFDSAISYNQNYYDAYQNKAVTLRLMGKYKESIEACKNTLNLFPDFAKAYCSMGWAYEKLNAYDLAIDAHLKALDLAPKWGFPRKRIIICLSQIENMQFYDLQIKKFKENHPDFYDQLKEKQNLTNSTF